MEQIDDNYLFCKHHFLYLKAFIERGMPYYMWNDILPPDKKIQEYWMDKGKTINNELFLESNNYYKVYGLGTNFEDNARNLTHTKFAKIKENEIYEYKKTKTKTKSFVNKNATETTRHYYYKKILNTKTKEYVYEESLQSYQWKGIQAADQDIFAAFTLLLDIVAFQNENLVPQLAADIKAAIVNKVSPDTLCRIQNLADPIFKGILNCFDTGNKDSEVNASDTDRLEERINKFVKLIKDQSLSKKIGNLLYIWRNARNGLQHEGPEYPKWMNIIFYLYTCICVVYLFKFYITDENKKKYDYTDAFKIYLKKMDQSDPNRYKFPYTLREGDQEVVQYAFPFEQITTKNGAHFSLGFEDFEATVVCTHDRIRKIPKKNLLTGSDLFREKAIADALKEGNGELVDTLLKLSKQQREDLEQKFDALDQKLKALHLTLSLNSEILNEYQKLVQEYIERQQHRKQALRRLKLSVAFLPIIFIGVITGTVKDLNLFFITHLQAIGVGVGLYILLTLLWWWKELKTSPRWKVLAAAAWLVAVAYPGWTYLCLPYKTAEDFISHYQWGQHTDAEHARLAVFLERYLERHPDSEWARIQLAQYYLYYAENPSKACEIASYMHDPHKYRYGAICAAFAYFSNVQYSETWDIIDQYHKLTLQPPAELATLEGTMLVYGYGCTKDLHRGINLLLQGSAAGIDDAFYQLGYILSHDQTDYKFFGDIELAPLDIPLATSYLTKAAQGNNPMAALVLGNLYGDFNVLDSALYYHRRALKGFKPGSTNWLEAQYKTGLYLEKQTQKMGNTYLDEAAHYNYAPAILHQAFQQKDPVRAIGYYEKRMPVYRGYRYLSPLAFQYLRTGKREKALQAFKASRPNGHFNEAFIGALEHLSGLNHVAKDSIAGMRLMRQSAEEGCIYAEMIDLYRRMEQEVSNGDRSLKGMERLVEIGKEIPFAQILEADLYEKAQMFDLSERAALRALRRGHPAGAYLLASRLNRHWFKDANAYKAGESAWYLHIAQAAIRYAEPKEQLLTGLFCNLYKQDLPGQDLEAGLPFWTDVTTHNHYTDLSVHLLLATSTVRSPKASTGEGAFQDSTSFNIGCRLVEAILTDGQELTDDQCHVLAYAMRAMAHRPVLDRGTSIPYGLSLQQRYGNNPLYRKARSMTVLKEDLSLHLPLSFQVVHRKPISNEDIFTEYDYIEDNYVIKKLYN